MRSQNPLSSLSRSLPRIRLLLLALIAILTGAAQLRADDSAMADKVDWNQFLSRHDLMWDLAPGGVNEAPIIGNGGVSSSIFSEGKAAPLAWQVYRIDVTDHRMPDDGHPQPLFDTCRLAIGRFYLQPVGTVQSTAMQLHLWDAVCTGTLTTDKGTISWRTFVPHQKDLIVVDFTTTGDEDGFTWKWMPYEDSSPRYLGKSLSLKKMTPEQYAKRVPDPNVDNYKENPPVEVTQQGDVLVSKHSLLAGGHFAVACREEKIGEHERVYRIAVEPVSDHATDDAVKAAQDTTTVDALFADHTAWWHAYYPASFLSVPETRLEGHYWIQNYKLASLTRPGGPPIDVYGYGMPDQNAGWPNIWWNMNVQENYYGCFEGNHPELGESLSGSLEKYADNLSKNVPDPAWQADSAWVGRVTDQQLRTEIHRNADGSVNWADSELSDLSWAMELYHRQCRYTADDERLKTKFLPLLEKCLNFYKHLLTKGPDGKLHLPVAMSPELGSDSDLNYDLGALRWDLATLIDENTRLGLHPEQMDDWKQLQKDIVDFPVGPHGLKIGANKELPFSHRHYSHLLPFYPLFVLDWDNVDQRPLIKQSVDYWYGAFTDPKMHRSPFFGYSNTGAASMFASMERGDDALDALHSYLSFNATPNAFYREGTIEVPFSVNQSMQEMLLQSRKGLIRVFPAMPSTWKDAVFKDLRTEGAFLVSGKWRDGKADWVRIQSLAGEPCQVRVHFDGAMKCSGGVVPVKTAEDTYTLPLTKGQAVILSSDAQAPDLTIAPVAGDPSQEHYFGFTKAIVERRLKATLKLAPEFKNGMTLPSDMPVPVSGTTDPGTLVIVVCENQGKGTTADAQGNWQVTLDPLKAGKADRTITLDVTGVANVVTIQKILVQGKSGP